MSSTHSGTVQKVDGMLRNEWILCSGFGGRHVPDLVDDFPRIMHYAILNDYPEEIIYLHINPEVIGLPFIVFTDGNARSNSTKQYQSLDDLEKLDWDLLRQKYWSDPDPIIHKENSRKRAAEMLIPKKIDPSLICCITTRTLTTRRKVERMILLANKEISVEIAGEMY